MKKTENSFARFISSSSAHLHLLHHHHLLHHIMGDEEDLDSNFEQIRHDYELLLKEKRKIEEYYEEAEQMAEQHQEEVTTLKKRNTTYVALVRQFQKREQQYRDLLTQISEAMERREPVSVDVPTSLATKVAPCKFLRV